MSNRKRRAGDNPGRARAALRPPALLASVSLLALASLALAACGGSSSAANAASKSSAASSTGAGANGAGRFAALRACLEKQGVKLPAPAAGAHPGGRFAPGGVPGRPPGGFHLASGAARSKLQEALSKCGAGSFRGARFRSPAVKAALEKYAACMRENGVNLAAPNASGSGPVFNTKNINTSSAAFKSAESRCRSDLPGLFAHGAPPSGGATGGSSGAGAPATG
ncbi:MAG TPA: hypothetical protein VKU89_10745 [Solirubrobacteraceae bacterium]|nr:hypothetical protein [Solirubrobacteraceae bacterium]